MLLAKKVSKRRFKLYKWKVAREGERLIERE